MHRFIYIFLFFILTNVTLYSTVKLLICPKSWRFHMHNYFGAFYFGELRVDSTNPQLLKAIGPVPSYVTSFLKQPALQLFLQ